MIHKFIVDYVGFFLYDHCLGVYDFGKSHLECGKRIVLEVMTDAIIFVLQRKFIYIFSRFDMNLKTE